MFGASPSQILRTIPVLVVACFFAFPAHAKYSGGTGEPNDPYQIATAADLMALGETPADYDKHFVLTADIDLDPNLPGRKVFDKAVIAPAEGVPIWSYLAPEGAPFGGVLDGRGHTISHLTIKGNDFVGLFGYVLEGHVMNVGVVDVNIAGSGYGDAGGLVGINCGSITNSYSTGAVSGTWSVGGLAGYNSGTIAASYSSGAVSGRWLVFLGGLVGGQSSGTTVACFWDTQTSGQSISGGGTGKTTAEMQKAKTFLDAGWDFVGETTNGTEDIWWILEGKDYPRLWWEARN